MKRRVLDPTLGPLVAMACKCSVWPISTLRTAGRCGECRVKPRRIPDWEDLPE